MKKRLIAILLTCSLMCMLSVHAAATEDSLPSEGDILHGFQVTGRGTLDILDCPTVTLEHEKSGSAVYYIASGDPNRTFDITFHTPAENDKGIPHILEHMTVSGSEKYPSPNIFFPAAYQTYNTFVNAMTDKTTTTFPVSSLSEDQLLKLMDLYLDGVFHPLFYTEPRLFEREAWRYDLQSADAPITITGTVYNEMKGAIDIYRAADYHLQNTLFPGSIIGSNSGGDPIAIPTLTYEELLNFHRTYYHPSNALVVLYGDLDLGRCLEMMDSYFSEYDRTEIDVPDGGVAPLSAPVNGRYEFPVEAGSDTSKGAVIGYGFVANGASREEIAGLNILTDLLSSDGSPVKDAVEKALPGAGFSVSVDMNFPQTRVTFQADGVDETDADTFRNAVNQGLAALVEDGVDRELILGIISAAQFSLRSITESSQIGPSLASLIASRWAVEGELDYLNFYSHTLEDMKDKAGRGWFVELAERYLLNNPHSGVAVTVPVAGLKEKQEADLAQRLADKKAAMSDTEIMALLQKTEDFAAWTAQEAPKSMVEALKAVTVQELPEELVDYPISDQTERGVRYLTAESQVSGIGFTGLALSLDTLPNEDLHWAALYAALLGKMKTETHTTAEVAARSARYLGSFYAGPSTIPEDGDHFRPVIMVQWIGMDEDYQAGLDLVKEMLFHTDVSDSGVLKGVVAQLAQNWKGSLNADPSSVQSVRMMACTAPEKYAVYDYMNGLAYYEFLGRVQSLLDTNPQTVVNRLAGIQEAIQTRTGAVSLYAGSAEGIERQKQAIRRFWNALPEREAAEADRSALPRCGTREAVVVDAAVQYNLVGASLGSLGVQDSGKLAVLAGLVSDQYLTPQLRHVAGAYGAISSFSEDGLMIGTYRDPSLAEAYQVFEQTGAAVSALELTQAEIDGYIMSAYSEAARPRGALTGAANAMVYHMMGLSTEDRLEELREIKSVTPADVKKIGAALSELAQIGFRSTFGGAAAIEGNRELFDVIYNPSESAGAALTRAQAVERLYGGACSALERAKADGVFLGDENGNYRENDAATREEMAVLLYRLERGTEASDAVAFADQDAVSPWALEAVRWSLATGRMSLDDAGRFRPRETVTADELPFTGTAKAARSE